MDKTTSIFFSWKMQSSLPSLSPMVSVSGHLDSTPSHRCHASLQVFSKSSAASHSTKKPRDVCAERNKKQTTPFCVRASLVLPTQQQWVSTEKRSSSTSPAVCSGCNGQEMQHRLQCPQQLPLCYLPGSCPPADTCGSGTRGSSSCGSCRWCSRSCRHTGNCAALGTNRHRHTSAPQGTDPAQPPLHGTKDHREPALAAPCALQKHHYPPDFTYPNPSLVFRPQSQYI